MSKAIETNSAPAAIGPYSQAIDDGETVYCSGQIGLEPASGRLVEGGVEAEMRHAMANLRAVLDAAGLGFDAIVKTTIYVTDLADFEIVNRIYGEHFEPPYPARATVQVAALPRGARVEIDAVARRPRDRR